MNSSKEPRGIEGWLALLCFALVIGGPLGTVYNCSVGYQEASPAFAAFPGLRNVFFIDLVLSAILMLLSVRAGLGLWQKWPGAVGVAKTFLLVLVGYSFVSAFLVLSAGLPPESNKAMMPKIITDTVRIVLFAALWYSYLSFSKRVKNTYHLDATPEEGVGPPSGSEIAERETAE